jgi:hypothetical protein
MDEAAIRATARLRVAQDVFPAPNELVDAMLRFEEQYGGLFYTVVGSNGMEHGLDGDATGHHTPLGLAFTGIVDGDWTWGVDVLIDGRTAMGPGKWPHRVIDHSIEQRLEKHALLVEVRDWHHRVFECWCPSEVFPVADEKRLPPSAPEATGPADLWWYDGDTAVQATLRAWSGTRDWWTVTYFARSAHLTATQANPTIFATMGHEVVPATWCMLCSSPVAPGYPCARRR